MQQPRLMPLIGIRALASTDIPAGCLAHFCPVVDKFVRNLCGGRFCPPSAFAHFCAKVPGVVQKCTTDDFSKSPALATRPFLSGLVAWCSLCSLSARPILDHRPRPSTAIPRQTALIAPVSRFCSYGYNFTCLVPCASPWGVSVRLAGFCAAQPIKSSRPDTKKTGTFRFRTSLHMTLSLT